jgi:hypothetical protein
MTLGSDSAHWLHETLSRNYGHRYSPDLGRALYDEFRDAINDEQLREAIKRHIRDAQEQRDGTPIGSWPPTVAHIEQQLTAMYRDKKRREVAAANDARRQESDRTYDRAMKSGLWREEIRKGAAIKAAILKEFVAADNVVVMQTLKAMQGERGLIDDIPRAIKTAARLIIARDKQNPQRQEAA